MGRWRFNLPHLFLETLLVAICAGAIRFNLLTPPEASNFHLASFDIAVISGFAAVGGLVLRPGLGALAGAAATVVMTPLWGLVLVAAGW